MCAARTCTASARTRISTPRSICSSTSSIARCCATRTSGTTKEYDAGPSCAASQRHRSHDIRHQAAMTLVAKLLTLADVVLDLQVSSKKRLFEQVGLLFENQHGLARSVVFDSLFARERLGSTGLGQGVAIPHGRIKGLKEALGAFIRVAQPVPFDAPDGNPVTLVFVLLVPEKATEKHLQLLSELAQMFSDKALREALALAWIAGREGGTAVRREAAQAASLIGHLNLTHPNSIQVIGAYEAGTLGAHVGRLFEAYPAAVIVADAVAPPQALIEGAARTHTPLFTSPLPAPRVIEVLARYLAKALAETTERHGVLMDVL